MRPSRLHRAVERDLRGSSTAPATGSIYNRHGVRIAGPAPRPLDIMQITVSGGTVVVDTSKITQRSSFEPSQAVPLP